MRRLAIRVAVGLALMGPAAGIEGATLFPGDLVVIDGGLHNTGGPGRIIRVNPATGAQTVVSSGGNFVDPGDIALGPTGDLFVVDASAFGGAGGVIRVDPATGAQTPVSSGGNFVNPIGLAVGPTGDLFVADLTAFGLGGGVIRVDPLTGVQTKVSAAGNFVDPTEVVVGPTGDLFVTDGNAFGGGGGVIRVDPLTGAQTPVASGGGFVVPVGLAFGPTGDLFVVSTAVNVTGTGSVFRVDPATGAQTLVSTGGFLVDPFRIVVGPTGDLYVADGKAFGAGGVIRINPATGTQTRIASGGNFAGSFGIVLVPPVIVTGAGPGGGPHVRGFETTFGTERFGFLAYDAVFTGGVHVAVGDVNGDSVPDVITGAGPGGAPHVKVFDGAALYAGTVVEVLSFFPYPVALRGGVTVGTVNLGGRALIVTGAGPGGGPHVRVFDGLTGSPVAVPGPIGSFFAYPATFPGGVAVGGQ